MEKCTLKTSCGPITGTIENSAKVFRGIPFAVTNRFEFPREYPIWKNELDATGTKSSGTDCYQQSSFPNMNVPTNEFFDKEYPPQKIFEYGDTPMCLNVITPLDAQKCPVVIFFHGGGHEIGKFDELPYGNSTEYAKRGIILVSVGYRLNVFSFYDGQNYGLHDMLFSIEWVKKHIESFGGNPNKITLMGQSAGAMSIMYMMYGEKLKGLVQGAIMLSGGGLIPKIAGPIHRKDAKEFWEKVSKEANADSIDELKNADPQILWYAWHSQLNKAKNKLNLVQPEIDGDIIPDLPQKIFNAGKDLDIPVIISVTSQDLLAPVMFKVALDYAKRNARKKRNPVYCAFFDRTLPGNSYKAFHSGDLWYAFGNMDKSWRPFEESDYELSKMMIDYYSNFIKSTNPNGNHLPTWKAVSCTHCGFRLFDGKSDGYIKPVAGLKKTVHSMLFDPGPL